jgi:hypothetical protein
MVTHFASSMVSRMAREGVRARGPFGGYEFFLGLEVQATVAGSKRVDLGDHVDRGRRHGSV